MPADWENFLTGTADKFVGKKFGHAKRVRRMRHWDVAHQSTAATGFSVNRFRDPAWLRVTRRNVCQQIPGTAGYSE